MSDKDNQPTANQANEPAATPDPIVTLGEKHFPGYFSPKDKVALIWSSAALILGGSILTAWLFSNDCKAPVTPATPPALTQLDLSKGEASWPQIVLDKKNAIKVIRGFTTEINGVNGWVIQQADGGPETQSVIYSSADGKVAFIGGMVSGSDNLTLAHFNKFADAEAIRLSDQQVTPNAPTAAPAKSPQQKANIDLSALGQTLQQQPTISIGQGEKQLVIAVDPNCPYCHQYYLQLMANEELQNEFTLKFMPVGILSMDSIKKAAMFEGLDNEQGKALLKKMMVGQLVAQPVNQDAVDRSMARTQNWGAAGLNVVPMTVFNIGSEDQKAIPGVIGFQELKSEI